MAMPVKTHSKENSVRTKGSAPSDVPQFFRLNIEVSDLKSAISFYTKLLGIEGRKQAGSRCYFECGPVTLQVLDVSSDSQPHPAAKALYFTVNDLEGVYERAKALNCFSRKFTAHQAAASSCILGANGRSMRWIHGEIPFVSSRREPFTREGTSLPQRKSYQPVLCTLKGFVTYRGLIRK